MLACEGLGHGVGVEAGLNPAEPGAATSLWLDPLPCSFLPPLSLLHQVLSRTYLLPGAGYAITEMWILHLHKAQQPRSQDGSVLITCAQVNSWGNSWASPRKLRLETSEERPRRRWHLIWALSWGPGEGDTPQQRGRCGRTRGKCLGSVEGGEPSAQGLQGDVPRSSSC